MGKVKDSKLTILSSAPPVQTRREFLKSSAVGGSALLLSSLFIRKVSAQEASRPRYAMSWSIIINAPAAGPVRRFVPLSIIKSKLRRGAARAGNPHLANIRVQAFNPDVDIPVVCLM